jgi:hypothetical protein
MPPPSTSELRPAVPGRCAGSAIWNIPPGPAETSVTLGWRLRVGTWIVKRFENKVSFAAEATRAARRQLLRQDQLSAPGVTGGPARPAVTAPLS